MSVPISRICLYILYLSCVFVLPHTTVFTLDSSVDVILCTPIPLVGMYGQLIPRTSVISVETPLHVLPKSSVHILLQEYLLLLPCVYVYVHGFPWSSMHLPPRASMILVAVLNVCLTFCPTHSCEVNFNMALGHLIFKSEVLSRIPCIIAQNLRNVAPCSGLVKKSAYISPIGQYFRDKSQFSIRYFIKKYHNQMCFVCFVLVSSPFFSMSIALMLSWRNSIFSASYPCPSIKYLGHRCCGTASSDPTISASVDLLQFIFCFRYRSIIDPGPMDITAPVCSLQSGFTAKDT